MAMMRWKIGPVTLVVAAALALPAPASAQTDGPPAETVFDGDYLTIGAGAVYNTSYEGSDNYDLSVIPLVQGSLLGIGISPRPGGVALDFIPDGPDAKVGFSLGPSIRVRRNRTNDIKDDVVERLGELDTAVEVGANAGVSFYKMLNPYDSLTFSAEARWDVAGAHEGRTISPSISYFTPLSKGAFVRVAVSAEHADDDYADYYFSVSPEGSAASGLPVFDADGGWKSLGATVLGGLDLDGDATNGGFALFALGGYSRLVGDFEDSPLVSIRGDADQWTIGGGIGYTF
jgi:MipA family protein